LRFETRGLTSNRRRGGNPRSVGMIGRSTRDGGTGYQQVFRTAAAEQARSLVRWHVVPTSRPVCHDDLRDHYQPRPMGQEAAPIGPRTTIGHWVWCPAALSPIPPPPARNTILEVVAGWGKGRAAVTARYLVFDAGCETCSRMAHAIGESATGKLVLVNISSDAATSILDRAFPGGWKRSPYLVEVRGASVRAWTGTSAKWRLGRLLGPRRSWRAWLVWRQVGTSGIQTPGADH
jgi:hypothetical protein